MSNFLKNIHPLLRRGKRKGAYDDSNFAVLNALNYELTQAERETVESKIQSSLETATGEYLDTWGDWFGVYRKDGWSDEYYRGRITRYLLLKRSTIPAIIEALADFLDDMDANIQIYEPWRNIFYLNKSKLNGEDHLMGYYYRFAIIDISIDRPFPPEIVDVIWAFKPAGVLFYLRMDNSLSPMTKVVNSGYVDLSVDTWQDLERWVGLNYNIRGNINLSQQATDTIENNIFYTNDSLLNGEDVLAGAFGHGRDLLHLACVTTLNDYTPTMTTTFSDMRTALGEASNDLYSQTKESDNRVAQITVPATPMYVHRAWSWSADGTDRFTTVYPNENIIAGGWELGGLLWLEGKEYNASDRLRTANFIKVNTGMDMIFSLDGKPVTLNVFEYDSNYKIVGTITENATNRFKYHVRENVAWLRFIKLNVVEPNAKLKAEIGNKITIYTPAPSEDPINAVPQYSGIYADFTETASTDPSDYTWYPVNTEPDYVSRKLYATFDMERYLTTNHEKDYNDLKASLGETQALDTLCSNLTLSTKLKALVSPSNGIQSRIQLFDFKANDWFTLDTPTLTLRDSKLNLAVNKITDYLNENKLLFVRYVFEPKEVDSIVELDMLNLTFDYRKGNGYTIQLQSSVTAQSELPVGSITLDTTELSVAIGETKQLTATILPETATNKQVEYHTANPSIATIDSTGLVTGLSEGSTEFTVYADDKRIETKGTITVTTPDTES